MKQSLKGKLTKKSFGSLGERKQARGLRGVLPALSRNFLPYQVKTFRRNGSSQNMNVLFDTNVLLDVLLSRKEFAKNSLACMELETHKGLCIRRRRIAYILTRDKDGFALSGIPVLSPDEFLAEVENN
ncbi:MAG: PIN domain-containing protein [Treponema sp.]|nr:PIN domain-containing protein [Treponema sp.]